jgi:hypothetical protein
MGKEIEKFVQESGVGADAWRRTGVLTFDGNRKVNKKVTFNRVKEYIEAKYGKKYSYGSIVQLCVARNARRRNSTKKLPGSPAEDHVRDLTSGLTQIVIGRVPCIKD